MTPYKKLAYVCGPWTLDRRDSSLEDVHLRSGNRHVFAVVSVPYNDDANLHDTAQLIAAAPEMYEALGSVCEWCKGSPDNPEPNCKTCSVGKALLRAQGTVFHEA